MVPPPGMESSIAFQGFEDRNNNVYIRLVALPDKAFAEIEKTMTNDALKKQGITVEKREHMKVEEGQGLLIVARQDAKPDRIRKWLLIAPLKGITGLISFEMPLDGKKPYADAAIRTALASVVSRSTIPNEEQLKLVPFTIGDLTGLRIVRLLPGAAIQLTDGPGDQFEPNQPHVVISVSAGGPSQPGEREQAEDDGPQHEQKNVFQPAAARHARRHGQQEHQRAELGLLLRGLPDEMEDDRQRDRERADEEKGREEAHAVAWCVVRGAWAGFPGCGKWWASALLPAFT